MNWFQRCSTERISRAGAFLRGCSRGEFWLPAFAMVAVVLIGANDVGRTAVERRQAELAALTEPERAQVLRNFARFESLPPAERQRLRDLDAAVRAEPRLNQLLETYSNWLKTLTPGQLSRLEEATDPVARAALVADFRQNQANQMDSPLPNLVLPGSGERPRGGPPRLSESELLAFLQPLVERLPPNRQIEISRDRLLEDAVRVVDASITNTPGGLAAWPPPDLVNEMIDALPPHIRANMHSDQHPEFRRMACYGQTLASLWRLWEAEFDRLRPGDEELRKFFAGLDAASREELSNLDPFRYRRELLTLYFKEHPTPEVERLMQMRERTESLRGGFMRFYDRRPGGGGGPGFNRPPGDRGRPDGGSRGPESSDRPFPPKPERPRD
ncbi:MAG: hypothetical protein KF777_08450 [Planctomycetaceae bacterium]|nr:hypothetical protein [Planctomycetaceae bacterium]